MTRRRHAQRGAALLVAMIVLTLVATLAAGMIWQQSRAIGVESAERARAQAAWILSGGLNLGRVLLRVDARTPGVDHKGEVWATPLQESPLSSMLAQDRDNNADAAPEAFLSGSIRDAQERYNLRNLVDAATGKLVPAEVEALARLCEAAAVPSPTAQMLAESLQAAWRGERSERSGEGSDSPAPAQGTVPLEPQTLDQLVWLGIDAQTLRRLQPYVDLLPVPTPLNINTASPEVLAGVIAGLDVASAKRLESRRPFRTVDQARQELPASLVLDAKRLSVGSSYFVISGSLRMDARVLEESMLVRRDGRQVVPLARWRQAALPVAQ
ncbi:MAG TPA: type II secretion system minor pseudopilin GspK [Rubrivivax sp.]|nr:type II secretion system minor pseudopilin GspK [Rubrivivax sp.]